MVKITRPFSYDLNQIPYDYIVEVTNRLKGFDLIDWLKNYEQRFMTLYKRQWSRPSPAGSQHTRPYPWQGHEGENLTGKADQVFRGSEKASSRDPTHDKVTRRKPDRRGRSCFQGFWKAAPGAHLKDDICLSDACFNRLLPNFCDTGRRPSPSLSK